MFSLFPFLVGLMQLKDLQQLSSLDLSFCSRITDYGILRVVERLESIPKKKYKKNTKKSKNEKREKEKKGEEEEERREKEGVLDE